MKWFKMNSIVALTELQAAKKRKLQRKLQYEKVKGQLVKITKLQQKKNLLASRLVLLSQGRKPAELCAGSNARLEDLYTTLWNLQEKLSAYRIIGPCGITVLEKTTNHLVVSFTSMWHQVIESFCLKITCVENHVKVSSTTIPYFIDVQYLLDQLKHLSLTQRLENIGHKLNAYIRRKGELDYIKKELKSMVSVCEANDAVTCVELKLNKENQPDKTIVIYLIYSSMDALLPETVKITLDGMGDDLDGLDVSDLMKELKDQPLSIAMAAFVPILR